MTSSIAFELCFGALWGVPVFGSGVACGYWLAEHNPPDDGGSDAGKSPTEERA